MTSEELVRTVRAMYEVFAQGDPDRYREAFSPDVVWHVPGENPVSGRYEGEAYFTDMPARMAPLDEWRFEIEEVLVNAGDRAALVLIPTRIDHAEKNRSRAAWSDAKPHPSITRPPSSRRTRW